MKTYPKMKKLEGNGAPTAEERRAEEEEEEKSERMSAQVFDSSIDAGHDQWVPLTVHPVIAVAFPKSSDGSPKILYSL